MKTIALVLLFLSFVAITTAQSQGCIVVNGNSECPAPTQWQSPNTASGSTNRGPAPFNELEAFQVCSGSCAAPRRACVGGNYNVSVELQACDVSTATNDQFVSGFDNDTCLTWGYAPARVVQTIEITIDCSTTPQCQCMYIPQALVLSVSNINDYVFGVVFTNGNPAITIGNTVTCPSSACVAPPPVFDGTVTTASITTGTGIITTGTPPPHSSTIVPSSNASSSSSSSSLALILGLALGLGIPFVLCCCLLLIAGIILLILFLKRGGVSSNTFWMPSRS